MSSFDPQKLSVTFIPPANVKQPVIGRKYTLTHSDVTAQLFLDIGCVYNFDAIDPAKRDEVLAEWQKDRSNRLHLMGVVHVDGGEYSQAVIDVRFNIFKKEMTTALSGMIYGDSHFLLSYPKLLDAPIFIHFESTNPSYNHIFYYGTPRYYFNLVRH
ncbi:hypothetical protein EJF36_12045 [Bacillus sp. HMF5848]|uniref:staygreen family protein n=1 Tax=Bacillus sp. HMF5848 TaxID=2495421 RepID=UPI000F7933D1|nr:staygreen family protein [Bacillus sp. HMF5848]RSK27550.1 hypothetical protein EJF36_12045 [Bacillus sp. HMF5848]